MIATATPTEETTTNTYGRAGKPELIGSQHEEPINAPKTGVEKNRDWQARVAMMQESEFDRAIQAELDLELDDARLYRKNWERALESNLHALQDYVYSHQLIVWQPGKCGASDVQLTTATSCTCQRFKLRDRCEHIAFVKQLEASGIAPESDVPVSARSIKESEEQAA